MSVIEDMTMKIKLLEEELIKTKEELIKTNEELIKTKEHLKKYTAPACRKTYYNNHREEILEQMKTPKVKEQRIEINKRAYQKRKEKLLESKTVDESNIIIKQT